MCEDLKIGKRYRIMLYGHAFSRFPEEKEPRLPARFDGIDGNFALFTVEKPKADEYPEAWAGTYRLPVSARWAWCATEILL